MSDARDVVYLEVEAERLAQDRKWGEQNHRNGTGDRPYARMAEVSREACERRFAAGDGSWADILTEEFYEALAEGDPAKLRVELLHVVAVAIAWVEAIDRRKLDGLAAALTSDESALD